VQEPLVADPAFLLDENAVHDGDLAGRTAEAEGGNAGPHRDRLSERDPVRRAPFSGPGFSCIKRRHQRALRK
jgi:hypothetical protein